MRLPVFTGLYFLLVIGLLGCADDTPAPTDVPDVPPESASSTISVLQEVFLTPRDTVDNVDSPAIWHGPDGQHWMLATAKETDVLLVHDAATGELLQRVGSEGTAPGQLDRPNGVSVIDDLALVVERNNARVQAFRLPDFTPLGFIGDGDLRYPYGLTIMPEAEGYTLFVTDNYETDDEQIPPDSLLGERVRQYYFTVSGDAVQAELRNTFGETTGAGVLRIVESILVDPVHNRLLIAEEDERASHVKSYTLDGKYAGEDMDTRYFPHQAEGIALYACPDNSGYFIATDQDEEVNTFHVFDRVTLDYIGAFRGEITRNTDGIALTQQAFGPFPTGAFYAVHDDGNVAAFQWTDIAEALDLRQDCTL